MALKWLRHFTASALRWETLFGSPIALAAVAFTLLLQSLFIYAPPMQQLFGTAALGLTSWGAILALALAIFLAVEAEKALLRRRGVGRF